MLQCQARVFVARLLFFLSQAIFKQKDIGVRVGVVDNHTVDGNTPSSKIPKKRDTFKRQYMTNVLRGSADFAHRHGIEQIVAVGDWNMTYPQVEAVLRGNCGFEQWVVANEKSNLDFILSNCPTLSNEDFSTNRGLGQGS